MSEESPAEKPGPEKNYSEEVTELLKKLAEKGVDFTVEDLDHVTAMDDEELREYLYVSMMEAGLEDRAEEVMVSTGLVEGFRKYTADEIAARNSLELKGEVYMVDEIDEHDRQTGAGSHGREDAEGNT